MKAKFLDYFLPSTSETLKCFCSVKTILGGKNHEVSATNLHYLPALSSQRESTGIKCTQAYHCLLPIFFQHPQGPPKVLPTLGNYA